MDVTFYKSPRETWTAMLADCRAAKKSIEMEQYILHNDALGNEFLNLFLEKQKAGVNIRLLLDRIGSRTVHDTQVIKDLEAAGAQVRFYNPPLLLDIFSPAKWFPRNHTKTTLIDSEIAYIGGVCLEEDMANWRDTQMRLTGAVVHQIEKSFAHERIGWRSRFKNFVHRHEAAPEVLEYVVHRPRLGPNPIYRRLVRQIHQAKDSILLVTPYFLPPFGLRRAIRKAARRGVKITMMVGGSTDAPLADYASSSYFKWMHRFGITIYLYKNFMLHAKYVVIDDNWATLGSTNLDYLSLKHNREANLIIRDKDIITTLKNHFQDDIKDCNEVDDKYWDSLPWIYKLIGYIGRYLKKIM